MRAMRGQEHNGNKISFCHINYVNVLRVAKMAIQQQQHLFFLCGISELDEVSKPLAKQATFFKCTNTVVKILKPWMSLNLCKRQQRRNMLYKKVKKNPTNMK